MDIEDPAAEITTARPLNQQVSSDATFALIKRWLSECHTSHLSCHLDRKGFIPTRLIKISADSGNPFVYLIETGPSDTMAWCSLSYVWGGDQLVKTTRNSLTRHKAGLALSTLPLTIRDAIIVAHNLSVHYIWVDSLCIIQDEQQDLARELKVMPQVYQHALLTISAGSANSVLKGFLQDRLIFYDRFHPFKLNYVSSSGRCGSLLMTSNHSPDVPNPLDLRGWTYQEKLLSIRNLRYTTTNVEWICRTCRRTEGDGIPRNAFSAANIVVETDVPCIEGCALQPWWRMVTAYSARHLTFPSDKLLAISALAHVYQSSTRLTYLSGLWKESLPQDLCWSVSESCPRTCRPGEFRAPSWSWAAVDGEIKMWMHEFMPSTIEINVDGVEVEGFLGSSASLIKSSFGQVTDTIIIIKGKTAPAVWHWDKQLIVLEGEKFLAHADALEDNAKNVLVLVLLVAEPNWENSPGTKRCGLLLSAVGTDTYRRVGFFECLNFHTDCNRVFSKFETRTIRLV